MSSLPDRIEILGKDLLSNPLRISAYHDLPFAILYYDPASEFEVRKQIRLFATRLQNAGKRVHVISIAGILWTAIRDTEGIEAIAEEEKQFGFARTQETVATLVSDDAFMPLPDQIEQRMQGNGADRRCGISRPHCSARASHLPLGKAAGRHAWPHVGANHFVLSRHTRRRK